MTLKRILFSILPGLLVFSCSTQERSGNQEKSWDVKNTRIVESYNEVNAVGIKAAQDSLFFFLELFKGEQNKNFDFFIKSKFTEGKDIENMWSVVDSVNADTLFASLNNKPLKLTLIGLGDKTIVLKGDVEDWSIYNGDSLLYGHFIERYQK